MAHMRFSHMKNSHKFIIENVDIKHNLAIFEVQMFVETFSDYWLLVLKCSKMAQTKLLFDLSAFGISCLASLLAIIGYFCLRTSFAIRVQSSAFGFL